MGPRKRTVDTLLHALLCLALPSGLANAQWKAAIPEVGEKGLYAIVLHPELLGRSKEGLEDIRLRAGDGTEVPYVIKRSEGTANVIRFQEYDILEHEVQPYSTTVIIERPSEVPLGLVELQVRPAEVNKHVRITGSDDRRRWFMVKDEVIWAGATGDIEKFVGIQLPPTGHRYFRLHLNDSLAPPVQILGVGRREHIQGTLRYTQAGDLPFAQEDGDRSSRIKVRPRAPLVLDRLFLEIAGSPRYHRRMELRTWRTRQYREGRKRKTTEEEFTVADYSMGSDLPPYMDVNSLKVDSFDLIIHNGDDRPLRVARLAGSSTERIMLAELRSHIGHEVITGDPDALAPQYDMVRFANKLPMPVDTLQHAPLVPMPQDLGTGVFDPSKWWLWLMILGAMAGMGYMANSMLRKVGDTAHSDPVR